MTAYKQRKIKELEAENAKLKKEIARLKKQLKTIRKRDHQATLVFRDEPIVYS